MSRSDEARRGRRKTVTDSGASPNDHSALIPAQRSQAWVVLKPQILLLVIPVLFALLSLEDRPPLSQSIENLSYNPYASKDCIYPQHDNCSFYANCLESRYNCGPTGYPIGYGQHFCQKFSDRRSELSEKGRVWMLKTMHCLQTALVPDAIGTDGTTCHALKRKAIESHAACYVDHGMCELPLSDWLAVVEIVQLRTLFQDWDATKTSLQAASECLGFRRRRRLR